MMRITVDSFLNHFIWLISCFSGKKNFEESTKKLCVLNGSELYKQHLIDVSVVLREVEVQTQYA